MFSSLCSNISGTTVPHEVAQGRAIAAGILCARSQPRWPSGAGRWRRRRAHCTSAHSRRTCWRPVGHRVRRARPAGRSGSPSVVSRLVRARTAGSSGRRLRHAGLPPGANWFSASWAKSQRRRSSLVLGGVEVVLDQRQQRGRRLRQGCGDFVGVGVELRRCERPRGPCPVPSARSAEIFSLRR